MLSPVHVLLRQPQQAYQNAAPKLGVKSALIIDHMDKALSQVELNMEVREVGGNAPPQALHQQCQVNTLSGVVEQVYHQHHRHLHAC